MATQTKDSLPWKLREGPSTKSGAFSDDQVSTLSGQYDLDVDALLDLSRKVNIALAKVLNVPQPELREAKIKKGIATLQMAIKSLSLAEEHVSKADDFLQDVTFKSAFAHITTTSPELSHFQKLADAKASILEFRKYLEMVGRHELVAYTGIPDKRRLRDVRREIVCVSIFDFWDKIGRKLTYSTDPVTSQRSGDLFDFVNSVVQFITEPPGQLGGDTIKQELEDFIASCTAEWVSGRIDRQKNSRPT